MGHLRGGDVKLFPDHIVGSRAVMLEGYARCIRIVAADETGNILVLRCESICQLCWRSD